MRRHASLPTRTVTPAGSHTGTPTAPGGPRRAVRARPSLVLWRWRHLVVGVCLGAVLAVSLSVLRPPAGEGESVLVVTRPVAAGTLLTEEDLTRREVPQVSLPASGLADESVVGSRAAVALEEGTVLTTSMTSAALAAGLAPGERLVQVPVDIGAELARPGSVVDVVAESPSGSTGSVVVAQGVRVVLTQEGGDGRPWDAGTKVTLVCLAVRSTEASLVVGAATRGALGIVLSP